MLGVDIACEPRRRRQRPRAPPLGLANLRFQEGDASHLRDLADNSFDLVVSMFGAMFAPRPIDVAREMVRVTRPGGRIVMGNWIAGDPTLIAQVLKISAAYTPPPPEGFISPVTWGDEAEVTERFTAAGIPAANIGFARDSYVFAGDMPTPAFLDIFRNFYGPTMNAFAAAEAAGRAADLRAELDTLFAAQNQSPDPARTSAPATFLKVMVSVP